MEDYTAKFVFEILFGLLMNYYITKWATYGALKHLHKKGK